MVLSNMCGAWNGLKALFLKDCPYAYYVHYFSYRLQLTVVAAVKNEISIWLFFSKLTTTINLISASSKRHTELHHAQAIKIIDMVATGERETGRWAIKLVIYIEVELLGVEHSFLFYLQLNRYVRCNYYCA